MPTSASVEERRQTVGEEIANSVSHGAGLAAILAAGPLLIAHAANVGSSAFFAAERLRYAHFVWHLFVVAGTTCHFVAIWRYAA